VSTNEHFLPIRRRRTPLERESSSGLSEVPTVDVFDIRHLGGQRVRRRYPDLIYVRYILYIYF